METDLLKDRVFDTVGICQKTDRPKFLGFLSLEETAFVENTVSKLKANYKFFGGYEDAQRVIFGCFPEWESEWEFPISGVTLTFRKSDSLTHRDVLGSLMALGLKREAVGDILIEEARAVLTSIYGVGDKVADCALLFGMYRIEAFPRDVWIKRVMDRLFPDGIPNEALPYSGIVQQYLFFYARSKKIL